MTSHFTSWNYEMFSFGFDYDYLPTYPSTHMPFPLHQFRVLLSTPLSPNTLTTTCRTHRSQPCRFLNHRLLFSVPNLLMNEATNQSWLNSDRASCDMVSRQIRYDSLTCFTKSPLTDHVLSLKPLTHHDD